MPFSCFQSDALWMGVPTISLHAAPAFTRGGLSILSAIDLPELAVNSEPAYLSKAIALAQDPTRLAHLRATMRDRLRASPLMDPRTFARKVEQAFRQMWIAWCQS